MEGCAGPTLLPSPCPSPSRPIGEGTPRLPSEQLPAQLTDLVFLVPGIHPVAIERNEVLDAGDWFWGLLVAPSNVIRKCVAHTERPVGGVSLVRSVGRMGRAAQEVHSDLVSLEVVDRRMAVLEHDHCAGRIDDSCFREHYANVLVGRLKRHWIAWPAVESGRRSGVARRHLKVPRWGDCVGQETVSAPERVTPSPLGRPL